MELHVTWRELGKIVPSEGPPNQPDATLLRKLIGLTDEEVKQCLADPHLQIIPHIELNGTRIVR